MASIAQNEMLIASSQVRMSFVAMEFVWQRMITLHMDAFAIKDGLAMEHHQHAQSTWMNVNHQHHIVQKIRK